MSARLEKLKRRAARVEAGLSASAIDDQREFEAAVARLRYRRAVEADQPIVRRDGRRRALAWVGLLLLALVWAIVVLAGAQ